MNHAADDYHGINPDGFGFVDVCGDDWVGHINLFWKDFPLSLVPPPIATEIRAAIILARQNGDRAGVQAVAGYRDKLLDPVPAKPTRPKPALHQQSMEADKLLLIANKGTSDELSITVQPDARYQIDNVYGLRGKAWLEFPRTFRTIAACKAFASRTFGEPQVWESAE